MDQVHPFGVRLGTGSELNRFLYYAISNIFRKFAPASST